MATAEQLVADDIAEERLRTVGRLGIADDHGLARVRDHPVHDTGIVCCPSTAPASCLDLHGNPLVGHLEQPSRAVEEQAPEVGDEPEGEHVDTELVDDPGQLVALLGRVELRLVAHQVVQRPVVDGQLIEVEIGFDLDGFGSDTQPTRHLAAFPVEFGEQHAEQLSARQVVVDLQRHRALARTHRAEAEAQRRHAPATIPAGTDIFEWVKYWRWAVVFAGTATLVAAPLVVARWPVRQPAVEVDALRTAVVDSQDEAFVGLVESRGGLRLPDLGRYDDEVAPFTQRTRSRVWYAAPDLWRASELLVGGERGTYREPAALWTWDSGDRDVERVPRTGDEPLRLPRVMDLSPAELGRRLVDEAGSSRMTVDAIPARRIAGHVGAGLRLEPPDDDSATTVDRIELWAEPGTGVVLGVEVYAGDGTGPPAFETHFVEVAFQRPADVDVRFAAADAAENYRIEERVADPIEALGGITFAALPDEIGGLTRRTPRDQGVATYGSGTSQITVVAAPSGSLGRRLARLPRTDRPWGGQAVVVSTSLLNAQIVTIGGLDMVVAGTVTLAELDRLVDDLLGRLDARPTGSGEGSA